jgi:hypothetical protein
VVEQPPLSVAIRDGHRTGDGEAEFAEGGLEDSSPLAVIGVGQVEHDGDV